jgi:hypothetical protein
MDKCFDGPVMEASVGEPILVLCVLYGSHNHTIINCKSNYAKIGIKGYTKESI